ncbi:4-hydroxy-3-methylbut-2-enyl diphosphate reductase [compost metagenome]
MGELNPDWLKEIDKVAVSSGASTPTPITKEVIQYLEQFDRHDPSTWAINRTVNMKRLIPAVREKTQ